MSNSPTLIKLQDLRSRFEPASDGYWALSAAISLHLGLDGMYEIDAANIKAKPKMQRCEAAIGGGENPPQCQKLSSERMCAEHREA